MSSETRQAAPRYWCHVCNEEVPIYMAPEPTCQRCNEQFIEELQADDDPREFLAGTDAHSRETEPPVGLTHFFSFSPSTGRVSSSGGSNNGEVGDDIFQYFTPSRNADDARERPPTSENPSPLGNFVQNLLTNMLGQNVDVATHVNAEGSDPNRPMVFLGNMVDGNVRFQPMPAGQTMPGGMPNNENTREGENPPGTDGNNNNHEDMRGNNIASLLQFLSAMTGGAIDGGMVGNPNDYVFSQTALDNVITQLMEQAGGSSAPPPAPEQVIESLKKRSLTDQEKSQETDCAVCKDQFGPEEQVIELPCEHIFHDECIKPWLKLNSTCPVCRHTVLPDQPADSESTDNNTPSAGDRQSQATNTNQTDGRSIDNPSTTTTFSFLSGGSLSPGGQQQTGARPLNLAGAFPWINFSRQASNDNTNTSTTTSATASNNTPAADSNNDNSNSNVSSSGQHNSSNNSNNSTNNDNMHLDDDLDLD